MNNINVIDEREVLGFDFKVYGDADNPLFLVTFIACFLISLAKYLLLIPSNLIPNLSKAICPQLIPSNKLNTTIYTPYLYASIYLH